MERLDPVVRELTADLANANTQLEKETIEQKLKVIFAFIHVLLLPNLLLIYFLGDGVFSFSYFTTITSPINGDFCRLFIV